MRTPECRCYGCGADDPMACGTLCADCSWEDHLASVAYSGDPFDEPDKNTPECCLKTRELYQERWTHGAD